MTRSSRASGTSAPSGSGWRRSRSSRSSIISVYFILPFTPAANPLNEDFQWKFVNYAPILTGGALLALWIGWHLSAKKWFTGPRMTIDLPEGVTAADEIALEHHGKTAHGGQEHDWKPGDPLS